MKLWTAFFMVIWCILALIAASYMMGCSVSHPTAGKWWWSTDTTSPKDPLHPVVTWTEIFMVVGIPIMAAGLALLVVGFFNPIGLAAHKLSIFLMTGGGSLFAVSAFLRVSLWLIPWFVYGSLALAAVVLVYEVYVRIKKNTGVRVPALLKNLDLEAFAKP